MYFTDNNLKQLVLLINIILLLLVHYLIENIF